MEVLLNGRISIKTNTHSKGVSMRGLTPQYFCSILSGFERIEKKIIWINDPNFSRLLYVSESYEEIRARKSIEL